MSKTATLSTAAIPAISSAPTRRAGSVSLRQLIFGGLGIVALAFAAHYGYRHLQYALAHEDTDDAQVEGDISPVLPRVSGYVSRVLVRDNEPVAAGQPVLEVDARELNLKVAGAEAALAGAKAAQTTAHATVDQTRSALDVAQASLAVAKVRSAKADDDLRRDTNLFQTSAITDRQLSDTRAAADVARTQLTAGDRQVQAARTEVAVAQAQESAAATQVSAKQADLDFARLQLSYATVSAPLAGVVTRKSVEPGQFVQAGQTLLSVTSATGTWVVANFKETQMQKIHPGLPVDVTVDSYPGVVFHGRVDSIAGTTGARFALLPPDNSSGNYVKVTQRVPVKIVFDTVPADKPLRPGMSVDAAVLTKE